MIRGIIQRRQCDGDPPPDEERGRPRVYSIDIGGRQRDHIGTGQLVNHSNSNVCDESGGEGVLGASILPLVPLQGPQVDVSLEYGPIKRRADVVDEEEKTEEKEEEVEVDFCFEWTPTGDPLRRLRNLLSELTTNVRPFFKVL